MTATTFPAWYEFVQRPDFDGQGLHNTKGDPGGYTNHGWIYQTWLAYAHLHDEDPSFGHFKALTKDDLAAPTRSLFWNHVQGDLLPTGVDFIWADFAFGSGGASRILQGVLDVTADGMVGPRTIAKAQLMAGSDREGLLRAMTAARKAYYKTLAVYDRFGRGWDRRADEGLVEAMKLCGVSSEVPSVAPTADDLMAAEQSGAKFPMESNK